MGADNTVYGLGGASDDSARLRALRELTRVLRPGGSLLVTTPLGEPGDHGWFRQEDEDGWLDLYASAGLFVEEVGGLRAHDRGLAREPLVPPGGRPLRGARPGGERRAVRRPAGRDGSAACSRPAGCAPPLGARRAARIGGPGATYSPGDGVRAHRGPARDPGLARESRNAEIVPNAGAWDREHRFPDELYPKLAELGLMGVCVPEAYGGAGADFLSYVLVLEELSRADAGVGVTVAVHTSATTLPILTFGTEEQRARFVPPLARGEQIGAFALTEPGSGSDAGSLRTVAEPTGDGWTITGSKQWITNGSRAGTFVLFARTDPATAGARGVSCFVLDADHVRVTREEEKLGLNSSTTSDLVLEGAQVGRDRLLHEEGRGFRVAMATLDGGRVGIAAQALGIAQAAFDVASAYAQEREQFGRRIADFQAIQWKLADMATEIDAARLLTYRAAWLKQEGRPHTVEGAKAKLFASEVARRQTAEAIQVLGGYGYTKEFPVERYYRDAKITEIYEGTSEIQRLVIARSILGRQLREEPVRQSGAQA